MKVIDIPISELKPYERNPRNNENAVDAVAESIKQFGFKQPIVIDSDHVIICGHTRLLAAKKLNLKKVPCVLADDLTEEQIKAYRLADNKVSELAGWNDELLAFEMSCIGAIDMSAFGFEVQQDEPQYGEAIEYDYNEEPPAEPKSKLGDIYQLGRHRLMCGDSTKAEDMSALMGEDNADMVFTDPPYNVDYADKNEFLNAADKGNRIQTDIENDAFADDESAMNNLWLPAFTNMREVADEYCSIYVTMPQGGAHMMMMMSVKNAGWQVKHELIWVKNNHVLGRTDYYYKHEPILYGWNKKHNFYGKGEFDKSVWEIPKPNKSDLHPTMKPIPLVVNALLNSSKENDIILDAFGGSGTTIMACEQTKRNARIMEFDPKYVDVIIDRWEKFTGQRAVKLN